MDATCEPQQENNILKRWNDLGRGVFPPENTSWYSFQVYMAPRLRYLAAVQTHDPRQYVNRTWGENLQAQMLSQYFGFDPRFIVDGSDQTRHYGSALRFQNSLPTGIAPGITLTNNRTFFGFKRHWSYIDQTGRPQETMGGGNCLYHAMALILYDRIYGHPLKRPWWGVLQEYVWDKLLKFVWEPVLKPAWQWLFSTRDVNYLERIPTEVKQHVFSSPSSNSQFVLDYQGGGAGSASVPVYSLYSDDDE